MSETGLSREIVRVLCAVIIFGLLASIVRGQSQDPTDLRTRELAMRVAESRPIPPVSPIALAPAVSATDLGVPSKARKQFEKARKLLLETHRSFDSIVFFQKAIDLAPLYSEAHFLLGVAYIDVGQYSEAERSLVKATSINDKNGLAYLSLGYCLVEQAKYKQAEAALSHGVETNPNNSFGHYDLGRTYYALNRFQEAEDQVRKAISLTPDIAPVHALLANVLLRTDRAGALHEFEEALRLEPNGPASTHIQDIIRQLKINSLPPAIASSSR